MIVNLSTEQIRAVDQMRTFVEGAELAEIGHVDLDGAYTLIGRTLERGALPVPREGRQGGGQALPREGDGPLPGPDHAPRRAASYSGGYRPLLLPAMAHLLGPPKWKDVRHSGATPDPCNG